jgi:hypothetical protein
MKALADQIEQTVEEHAGLIKEISDSTFGRKSSPARWSKKEILGHLVDSALNNLQRLIRGQYESNPKIIYNQDAWVNLSAYQGYEKDKLISFWTLINLHYCHILRVMDTKNVERQCDVGKPGEDLRTLKFLAEDYLTHMIHHLSQITAGE